MSFNERISVGREVLVCAAAVALSGPAERPKIGSALKRVLATSTLVFLALALSCSSAVAADDQSPEQKQQQLISVLKSDAPKSEKAITCKELAIYGTDTAVPSLAPLLADPELSSWARIALEAIPGPAADKALRDAVPKVQGRLLVGVLNSIGVRRDALAVRDLSKRLQDADAEVASAAAVALGRIGGNPAASALQRFVAKAPVNARQAAAEGCIRCAERFLADGKSSQAAKLYDRVRQANVPKQKILEATRGAILARGAKGVPLLLAQLRSDDKALCGIGLRTARELAGPETSKALADELSRATVERQPMLLLALADRKDPASLPTLMQAAKTGSPKLRLTAVNVLEQTGNAAVIPVLLDCATDSDAELSQAAVAAMTRMAGPDVDSDVTGRLQQSSGKLRQVLIQIASRRGNEKALPTILQCAEDTDPGVRSAAVQAMGALGNAQQVPALVKLLEKTQAEKDRAELETALVSVVGRGGAGCASELGSLARSSDTGLRITGLHALAAAGGSDALTAVNGAVEDKDEAVQDEAVRTLCSWPNTWPEDAAAAEPLLALAKSAKKPSHQVLAVRACLQFLQGDKKFTGAEKVSKVKELLPLITRPEEKQLAIAVLHPVRNADALQMLTDFAADSAVAEDACSAILETASKEMPGVDKEQRQKALQLVLDKSSKEQTRNKAEAALKKLE